MNFMSIIPLPWRLAILATLAIVLLGTGFAYGARYEVSRQKAEAHDELVAQLVSSQKRIKEDNEIALATAKHRQSVLAAAVSSRDKTISLMKERPAYRECKLDDDVAKAINEALPK